MVDSNNFQVLSGKVWNPIVNKMKDPRSGMFIADNNEIFSSKVTKNAVKSRSDSCDDDGAFTTFSTNDVATIRER
jgi:hypothetical protein